MSAILEIRDGTPHWWNSTDIWVVPGNDPNGTPGQPVAGEPAYMWGKVSNKGKDSVTGAQVKFYWSNPATGVLRSNSTLIGSAFVDLDVDEVQDVLCLIPWIPTIVNDGHECIVAEVIHPSDPLPQPLPDRFDPPAYRQIAQRNLTVLAMKSKMMMMTFQVATPARERHAMEIELEIGGQLDKEALVQLGLPKFKPAKDGMLIAGLTMDRSCDEDFGKKPCDRLKLELKPGTARAVYLKVAPKEKMPGHYTLVNVVARDRDRIIGGLTCVAINSEEE